ncbi:NlpC/P60 family protein, partial [Streptomyces sp. NPDC057367]|uniref:NlpC/P60 family protein n=1 Tax=Streptomyces sp. NPDC057367 TaxID=3346108 RepID=UPI0036408593
MKNIRSPRHAAAVATVAAVAAGLTLATALPAVAETPAAVGAASDHGSPGQGPVTSARNSPSAFAAASSAAPAIKRSTVMARADSWVGKGLDYSWTGSHEGYRTDCSGYVSMAWNLDRSLTTPTFASAGVTETISKGELKAGDALLDDDAGASGHIVLFHKWANDAKTQYWGYEFTGSGVHHRQIPYPYFAGSGPYVPVRNKSIVDDAPAVEDGSVWDRELSVSGQWQSAATHVDENTRINGFAA